MIGLPDDRILGSSDQLPIRVHVKSLTLSHFRNYVSARLVAGAHPVVLIGQNGAGKTNILEAISLLTPGRGLRRAAIADMDNLHAGKPWAISSEISGMQGEVSVGTGREAQALGEGERDRRIVKIDGKTARGQASLAPVFSALWLTPQMDNLFVEGGTARRKFLDRLVYSFDAGHAARVNAYEFAMRERNRLLAQGQSDDGWLSALEQKMAEQGVAIAAARAHAAEGLGRAMQLARHSFPKAHIAIRGTVEDALQRDSALLSEEKFRALLAASRAKDAAAGRTLEGVHRARVEVTHSEKNMEAQHCSTGEQKALLVSIILAQARAGAAWHGGVPALLLDEVATHLDPARRGELYAELATLGAQAWITGTDREIFAGLDACFLKVENAAVMRYA